MTAPSPVPTTQHEPASGTGENPSDLGPTVTPLKQNQPRPGPQTPERS